MPLALGTQTGGSVLRPASYCGVAGFKPSFNIINGGMHADNGIDLQIVKLPEAKKGFVLLPRRWVVERSFGWVARFRRLARDYERLASTLAGYHWLAFVLLMLKNLFAKSA